MSYDLELVNKKTGETAKMRHAQYVRGGTVPAVMDPVTGNLVQAEQIEASINVTFNYGRYYYEATDGGLPGLDGTTPAESIPMLMDMVEKISKKYRYRDSDDKLEWIITEREKRVYFKDGEELTNISFDDIFHHRYDEARDITYHISEGDMSNYWTATAANAIKPLLDMIVMATDNLTEKDVVWKVSY